MSPTRADYEPKVPGSSLAATGHFPFSVHVVFSDDLIATQPQMVGVFEKAANRWLNVIVGGGGPVVAGGETIDGLLILADCKNLGREGGLAANTDLDLSALRGGTGVTVGLPAKATITLDATDMKALDE